MKRFFKRMVVLLAGAVMGSVPAMADTNSFDSQLQATESAITGYLNSAVASVGAIVLAGLIIWAVIRAAKWLRRAVSGGGA